MQNNSAVHDEEENDFQPANTVTSDYAMNIPNSSIRLPAQTATSEYVLPSLSQQKGGGRHGEKKDEYASAELRQLVNKAIDETKEKAKDSKAQAMSASKLRAQVANLDDAVYVPTVMNGQLHFVSLNDDTRTARGRETSTTRTARLASSKSTSAEDVTTSREGSLGSYSLSLDQLQQILGLEAVQAVLKKFKENPSAFMKRARNRSRHRSTITCASPSTSNTSEKGVTTARSIESLVARPEEGVFTAQDIDEEDKVYTARSETIKGLKFLQSDSKSSVVATARDKDGFELTEQNFTDREKGSRWHTGTPKASTPVDMRSRASPATSLSGYFNTAVSDHPTALSHRDGAITAKSDSFTSLVGGKRSRANSLNGPRSYNPLSDDTSTACNIGSPYKATTDMRSRAYPSSSLEQTARTDRSSTMTGVYGNELGPVNTDMRSRAFPSSSYEKTAEAKTSSTNTAIYGNQFGPVGADMRSRAQPASSCERTADLKTSNTRTALFGDKDGPVGSDMRSRAFPSSSCERTAEAKTSSTNTALVNEAVGVDMRSRAYPPSSNERTAKSTSQTNTAVFGDRLGPVNNDMRSRAQPASSHERTARSTSQTNTAVFGYHLGPVGNDMRSRAQPASSCERTANAKTSSTNTAIYGNQFGPVGGDMRSRAIPSSSYEKTARSTSETNTAVFGDRLGPVNSDMRSRAQPASSCERTANAKTSSTNTALVNEAVGVDMRSRAFPSSSHERTAEAKTSSTNTAIYGNQFGPVGGDMRSRAIPSSSCEKTAKSTSQTNTAVFGDQLGPVGNDMRSRAYPTSSAERTAKSLSEVNTAQPSKSAQEIEKMLNNIISEISDGDNEDIKTAADKDASLSSVHPSVLTQTPLSDCKAASAVPSIGNFQQ